MPQRVGIVTSGSIWPPKKTPYSRPPNRACVAREDLLRPRLIEGARLGRLLIGLPRLIYSLVGRGNGVAGD